MLEFITENINILNLIISTLALLAAIYAVVYTHVFNRRQIEVDGFYIDPSREEATELTFSINNISPKSITVNKISFICDGIEVQSFDDHKDEPEYVSGPLGIKIKVPSLDNGIPDILESPTVLLPNSHMEFTYYLPHFKKANIRISCNQRIHHLSKEQTFSVPRQSD